MNPESRGSGFDASHRPGTTVRQDVDGRDKPGHDDAARLLLEVAHSGCAGIGADHAAFLAVLGYEDVPVCGSAALAFHDHHPGAIGIQGVSAMERLTLSQIRLAHRSLLAGE